MDGVIVTYSGRLFKPLDPDPNDIDPIDIAHALSNQCRYTGHTKFHYSVATHSCLVHDYIVESGEDEETCVWGLVHDAPEFGLLDLPAPLKHHVDGFGDKFREAEAAIEEAIAARFGLSLPIPDIVKEVDVALREDEIDQLFPYWPLERKNKERLGITIPKWEPERGKEEMILRMRIYDLIPSKNSTFADLILGAR